MSPVNFTTLLTYLTTSLEDFHIYILLVVLNSAGPVGAYLNGQALATIVLMILLDWDYFIEPK